MMDVLVLPWWVMRRVWCSLLEEVGALGQSNIHSTTSSHDIKSTISSLGWRDAPEPVAVVLSK